MHFDLKIWNISVTFYDVLASRSGQIPEGSINNLATLGVIKTKDNKIMMGIRGGEVTPERVKKFASGLYGMPPAGSVTFKTKYDKNPIQSKDETNNKTECIWKPNQLLWKKGCSKSRFGRSIIINKKRIFYF